MFKRIDKLRVGSLFFLAAGFLFVLFINFSTKEQNFFCAGTEMVDGKDSPTSFFLKFERFRWFILWSDDDGSAWVETQDGQVYYFAYLDDSGVDWNFADQKFLIPPFGKFSSISNKAMIGIRDGFVVEGECQKSPNYK
ncbi:hypothetical protein [Thalassospira alkalitolerans]|uniref:Lipoprotein n=1 Tax=Thalassospira alkalitolerans TaxID=1293890 RepID=A0A1Y2L5I9_9PROT|nr:hypothetical protein [Thalassospira alkalitolerans]OSQ42457.1 hypothetical protein TALK_21555 [Thalassospira alkalitolerans]|tara:strand:- start:47072 stop:47485 length:414 start_codon:yes stop_codon:yes gene_type:complete